MVMTYIEYVGRIIFTSDHKVRIGFPKNLKDGRKIVDGEFKLFSEMVLGFDAEEAAPSSAGDHD